MDIQTAMKFASMVTTIPHCYGEKTGDWTKPKGRVKRKRKQRIQKLSRRRNRGL